MGFLRRLFGRRRNRPTTLRDPDDGRYIVRDGVRLEYRLVRKIWELDARDEDGDGSIEKIELYSDELGDRYYLYYTDNAYNSQYGAGAIRRDRFYFPLDPEEMDLDDDELVELCARYIYAKN